MAKHSFPHLKVTVVESKEIGIIGVGEGSTEHWQTFMNHIKLNFLKIQKKTIELFG